MKTITLFLCLGLLSTACGKKSGGEDVRAEKPHTGSPLLNPNSPANELVAEAVRVGDIPVTRLAIERGANVDLMLANGSTLLTEAIGSNYTELVDVLLAAGANASRRDRNGRIPVLFAMFLNRGGLARRLIRHGADIDTIDNQGRSILMLAIEVQDVATAEWLLEEGANLDIVDNEGKTAAVLARNFGNTSLFQAIELRQNVTSGVTSEEVLRRIFEQGDVESLRAALIRSPSILRVPLPTGPVFQVVQGARPSKIIEMLQLVLDQGLPVDGQPTDPRSPLSEAAARGLGDVVDFLILRGANIEHKDELGWTPLIHAIRGNQPVSAARLLERGARRSYNYLMNDRTTIMNGCSFMRDITTTNDLERDRLRELRRVLKCPGRGLF